MGPPRQPELWRTTAAGDSDTLDPNSTLQNSLALVTLRLRGQPGDVAATGLARTTARERTCARPARRRPSSEVLPVSHWCHGRHLLYALITRYIC